MNQPDLFGVSPTTVVLSPVAVELKRREGNYQAVLSLLQRGPATNHELAEVAGYRFSARIHELREDGAVIDRAHVGGGTYRYAMTKGPNR